jgi:ABC-type branched-subunit amino acid transport system substrate-binding protein
MLRRCFAASIALALVACFGLGGPGVPDEGERHAYQNAIEVSRRSSSAGRAALAQFLDAYPDGALADDADLALARLERDAGRTTEAEQHLRDVIERHPKGDRADSARLELAALLRAGGRRDAAWEQATQVRVEKLGDAERRGAERLLADLARERGDRAAEVEWLARLRASTDDAGALAALDREIDVALAALPTDQLLTTAEGLGRRVPAGHAWLLAAERSMASGDRATAWRAAARAAALPLEPDDAQRLVRLQAGREAPGPSGPETGGALPTLGELGGAPGELATPASGAIGVVLPLSGAFAPVAEQTLRGVLLAAGVFAAEPAAQGADPAAQRGGLRVLVRDTGGRADRAAAAVHELAARGDVAAVLGPLLTGEVQTAAAAARETGIPLLALTRHESVSQDGGPVFRVGLTRRMEAEVLADHAVRGLGLERFAILHPDDEYGREFEALLWQALEARGAHVVAVAGYDPGGSDFVAPIRRLVGYDLLTDAERALLAERGARPPETTGSRPSDAAGSAGASASAAPVAGEPLPPIVDFQALFIPDAPDKIALITPQLALADVDGVTLFGPSAWHHPDLVRGAGPRLEGAFFTSAFDPENPSPFVREFVRRYQAAYGDAPSAFAAQGFDAANLVAIQMVRGASAPADLRKGLLATTRYPGVSGATSFEPDGNARKRPFLIEVRGGALRSLE